MAGERASDPRASGFLSPLDRFEAVAPRKVRRLAGGLPGRAVSKIGGRGYERPP
jgi:hypothetical protein